ncbi:MAG: tRNA (adenosine(37)-N6)-threonylcarbamoyltransferase complex dimerization subunit type 1 TsaB, partial [Candidatus Magnetoovum sp. WYHC-5]|nr:tRNA (adenosine(37)-N6)-threonylcarbamoyltransferase complex dimerization subunit type 1 TsaB [Candidatus Magnetoovum sp. WYHC-5]
MLVLSIDTSGISGSVSLISGMSGILGQLEFQLGNKIKRRTHSETLVAHVDYLLKATAHLFLAVDAFCVVMGPGSFTGLRVGLCTVKGFAFATGKPIVGVNTFDALAWNFPYARYPVCTIIDAGRQEVYAAVYIWQDNDFMVRVKPIVINIDEFLNTYVSGKTIFTGTGAVFYMDKIKTMLGNSGYIAEYDKIGICPSTLS